ncbi:major facilitator superfamily domain-containing protein [Lophiotrema nucula]|uniref:Major facilitator superfamily domain-containing protein n=1 Tax=Lophiotrema nucula TaxID=690887 RepID=A0A6A5ZNZ1_9PLEO|nr:major facilitator superfamily domain-containing protein [Lophiotrema nucula]
MATSQPAAAEIGISTKAAKVKSVSYMSLPYKRQLAILCLARICDPLAISSIQSYMYYQLKFFDPHASNATLATQAGVLVSARTAAQVFTGLIWGHLADSDLGGRKAVLFVGLISCSISYIGYGLARSLPAAIFWQVFAGLMSNNVAITRTVVAELNPEKRYRTRALLLLPLSASTAQLLGPLVGGLLSSNSRDIQQNGFPYLPPNLLLTVLYLVTAILVLFFMDETLESLQGTDSHLIERIRRHLMPKSAKPETESDGGRNVQEPLLRDTSIANADEETPLISKTPKRKRKLPFRRIWTANVSCTMLTHFIIVGHLGTFPNVFSVFLTTPTGPSDPAHRSVPFQFTGGLGLLPRDVGLALSFLGALMMALQLGLYPRLQDRFGTVHIWRSALFVFPLVYLVAPFPSLVASAPDLKNQTVWIWLSMAGVLLLFTIGRTGVVPATTLLINDCTPHPSVRGTVNAAATVLGHLSRSIFPVIALGIFGQGLKVGAVGIGFWCLAVLAVLSCIASRWVQEGSNGQDIVLEEESDEEEDAETGALRT